MLKTLLRRTLPSRLPLGPGSLRIATMLFLCLVAACKQKSTPNTPVNADLLAHFNYKPGTFWVYKDSVSGDIDSFVVYENLTSTIQNNIPPSYDEKIVEINFYDNGVESIGGGSWNLWENCIQFYLSLNDTVVCDYQLLFQFPFQPVGYISLDYNSQQYSVINYLPSVSVAGNNFDSVTVINETIKGNSYNDQFFISPSAGIIKIRYNHDTASYIPTVTIDSLAFVVLELQRYNIVH